jgi:hypothetical protein
VRQFVGWLVKRHFLDFIFDRRGFKVLIQNFFFEDRLVQVRKVYRGVWLRFIVVKEEATA